MSIVNTLETRSLPGNILMMSAKIITPKTLIFAQLSKSHSKERSPDIMQLTPSWDQRSLAPKANSREFVSFVQPKQLKELTTTK